MMKKSVNSMALLLPLTILASFCQGFDLFYWRQPNYYEQSDPVPLLVNRVESDVTQLPYAYYDLPFTCPPTKDARPLHLSLNEVIRGDRLWESDYLLNFNEDASCHRLCDRKTTPEGLKRADELIRNGYVVEWLLDDLPGATTFISSTEKKYYAAGFPLGFVDGGKTYINNHVMMVIRFHTEKNGKKTIVGFEVYPRSVSDFHCPGASKNFQNYEIDTNAKENTLIPFTYAVYWREDADVSWNDRWDLYFEGEVNDDQIHWLSLINSLVLVSFLSAVVGVVLLRTLNRDIQTYNSNIDLATDNIVVETDKADTFTNSGWKLISNDVFRIPSHPLILSVTLSSGVQVFFTIIGVLVFSTVGFLGPNVHNSVLSTSLFFFILGGTAAGYSGVRFYKNFTNNNTEPVSLKKQIMFGATLPAIVLSLVLVLNCIVWAKDSSNALPFGTVVLLIFFLLVLEVPLSIIGGVVGNKAPSAKINANLSKPIREIPMLPKFLSLKYMIPIFGLIPFGTIYVELLFIFRSVWLEKTSFYYMYGFLLFTICLLFVVVLESVIVGLYLALIYGDWRWQWRSFWIGSSVACYIEVYSVYYFFTKLNVADFSSVILFFSYTTILSVLVGLAMGSVGLYGGSLFVYRIYGAIKSD